MTRRLNFRSVRGSALITVVMLVGIMALLSANVLKYSGNERRSNERNRLTLRARNMSENISVYAAEQLTTKLYRLRSPTQMAFMTGTNEVFLPPTAILDTAFTAATTGMEVRAGLTTTTGLTYIDPAVAANANNPNVGLQASTNTVPIIAKATANHVSLGSVTAYCQDDMEVAMIPLFQFAIFYNMDMEFSPGANMTINGPVHTNGNLIARGQTGFSNTVEFADRVTVAKGFYANTAYKGSIFMDNGAFDTGPGGTGALNFTNPAGTRTDIKVSSTGVWRDHKFGAATESATTLNQFKTFATSSYGGNLRTSVHGVTNLVLPSIGGYAEADDPDTTTQDERNNGRQVIEIPAATDTAGMEETKFSRRAGLYIVVNPTNQVRNGVLPGPTPADLTTSIKTVPMRARSYRCWLNTSEADGTHTLREVILPGQPSYGDLNANVNNLPNAYRADTSIRHNQVLRIPKGGGVDLADTGYAVSTPAWVGPTYVNATDLPAFSDAYFYDMRRAKNNRGYPASRSGVTPYIPRPIAKIDFDMTRFKMAVERTVSASTTSNAYYPSLPTDATTWGNFIYKTDGTQAVYGLGMGPAFNVFGSAMALPAIQKSQAATFAPGELSLSSNIQVGIAAPGAYAGRYTVEETTNATIAGAVWTLPVGGTSAADESSKSWTPTPGTTFLRLRLYLAGGVVTKLDEQIIPVVTDGTTTTMASLTNDYVIVPSVGAGGSPVFNTNTSTEIKVYIGATDDTANWTYTAAPSAGITGAFGTGPAANRYTVTAMTNNNSTVVITAAKTGYANLTKTFTLAKQSAVAGALTDQTGRWLSVCGPVPVDPYRMYFAPGNPTDPLIKTNPASFAVGTANLVNVAAPCPWFDGITVYIQSVDAEDRALTAGIPNRVDSGVRLWNGRGTAVSLNGATYPGRTGFSICTNDPVYVVGHFNADGLTVAPNNTSNPARYPDNANEKLTSVMGDAITILSQPTFEASGATYRQNGGWSDSLSAHRRDDGTSFLWSSSWATTDPTNSNRQDGINSAKLVGNMPNQSVPGIAVGSGVNASLNRTEKFFPANVTEISTCFLIGIVPTNHDPTGLTAGPPSPGPNGQSSGGVHNYPRLLEGWSGNGLYIRGSMVAMFESRVAMEPWSIRVYNGAGRYWGLHESLRNANHDVPLEPIVLNARRMRFKELTAAQYSAQKTIIEALPH